MIRDIQVKRHIIEGEYVATVFDMENADGVDHVFDRIHIIDGEIKGIHAFYYPKQVGSFLTAKLEGFSVRVCSCALGDSAVEELLTDLS
jgi:hypothetical protein